MKNLARNIRLSVILTAAFFSASCGSVDEPVNFSTEWPTKSPGYEEAATRWTRRGVLRAPLEQQASQLMEIYATYLSNDWRAAYVERQSKLQKLNGPRKAELAGQQQQTALAHHEVELLITTYYQRHNDLHRKRSIWRVTLVDDQGNEIVAEEVERDRRPREVIAAEFEHFGDFAEAYVAKFPAAPELLSGKKFSLRVASSLGMVELDWVSKK
tara:strand:- start:54898 stop:55536 length:639 start_codon:yes stop_codon:yes gene_type:complete